MERYKAGWYSIKTNTCVCRCYRVIRLSVFMTFLRLEIKHWNTPDISVTWKFLFQIRGRRPAFSNSGIHDFSQRFRSRDGVVDTTITYGPEGPGFGRENKCFLQKYLCRLWGPHSLLLNWYGGFIPGVKRPGREFDHSPSSGAKAAMSGAISLLPTRLHVAGRDNFTF
jgi:hypothetical protein